MKAVRRLEISYGGDASSLNVDFLLACSKHDITDISIDTNSNCGTKSSSPLHAENIVAFVLAGATDGQHRKIEFDYDVVDANRLLQLLSEETRKLAPCPHFTFELLRLREVDLRLFAHFLHGDVMLIDGGQNGMLTEIKIKKESNRYQNNLCDISTSVTVRPLSK